MAKEVTAEAATAAAVSGKKIWVVEWEVFETKDKAPAVRRKYFIGEEKAKKFAEKLREAIALVGCSGSSPSYTPLEVEE